MWAASQEVLSERVLSEGTHPGSSGVALRVERRCLECGRIRFVWRGDLCCSCRVSNSLAPRPRALASRLCALFGVDAFAPLTSASTAASAAAVATTSGTGFTIGCLTFTTSLAEASTTYNGGMGGAPIVFPFTAALQPRE